MIKKYLKLGMELFRDIKNRSILRKELQVKAFGLEFVGQGYMIDGYSSLNHDAFFLSLKKEVDFIRGYKNSKNINIIDAGANLGFYSIIYSILDNTSVISFEPFPDTYKHLKKNVEYNNIKNVLPLQFGLYSKKASMPIGKPSAFDFYSYLTKIFKFTDKEQLGCYSVYTSDENALVAKFIKGDECKDILAKDHIDLIKIDVEGSELEVLKGLKSIIKKHHPVLKIEFNQNSFLAAGISNEVIWDYLDKLEYKEFTICSNNNDFTDWRSMEKLPNLTGSKDLLFI
ncbi:FkbM family methyltransferase [Patescibacteria group bacterium]|nr:FkbM family methyltransferase [Patescibacteria group bacterium]